MSQAGEIDVINSNPQIPTSFVTDSGTAIPLLNEIEILATTVPAGTTPIETTGAGNTVTIQVQISNEVAAADITKVGLSNFDSAAFDVDASGFVTLTGGGVANTEINVDASTAPGTDPVVPLAGVITMTGAQVASGIVGTNVIRTDSLAANTLTIEIQRATIGAAPDLTKNGVSHFNSAEFAVDANGFVSLAGGGLAIDSFSPDSGTDPIVPTVAGLVNMKGSGSITTVGSLNTLTTQLTGLTNHAVLVGAGTTTITNVGPTATVGQILQSAGAAADPAFSTATYPLTTTVSEILYSSSTNVVSGLATANRAVLTTGTTGIPVLTAIATDGQMIIGSTAGAPAAGTITSTGGTIAVTTGSNTLNLEVTGGGFTWTDVTGATQTLAVQNGYITDRGAGVVYTLPATAVLGSEILIVGKLGLTTITPNANQQILIGSASGTVGVTGTAVGTNVGDCISLDVITAGASTVWRARNFVGNWTLS